MNTRLRALRKSLKIRQYSVAKSLNISPATYNRYETGALRPDIFKLCKIADIYNVSIDYIMQRTDMPCLIEGCVDCEEDEKKSLINFILKYNALNKSSKKRINHLLDYEYAQNEDSK